MEDKKKEVMEYKAQSGEMIRINPQMVRDFLVQGKRNEVTVQEIFYFMHICKARKLNPFVKDCYLIKYGNDPAAIVTSVDYFRKNARKAEDCRGWKAGVIILADKEIIYREGNLVLESEVLVGGWAEAKPDTWNEPKKHSVNLETYIKRTRDGAITRFWAEPRQPDMIAKVAETQLLRQIWGEESTGMYAPEEMPSLEDVNYDSLPGEIESDTAKRLKAGAAETENQEKLAAEMEARRQKDKEAIERDAAPVEGQIRENPETGEKKVFRGGKWQLPEPIPPGTLSTTDGITIASGGDIKIESPIGDGSRQRAATGKFEPKGKTVDELSESKGLLPKTETEDPPPEKANEVSPGIPQEWDRKVWARKKTSGFTTHVWANLKTLPPELEGEVRQKWFKLHGTNVPFPKDAKPEGNDTVSEPSPEPEPETNSSGHEVTNEGTVVFHDPEDFDDMPITIQTAYADLAEKNSCEIVEVNPKAVNSVLKRTYKEEWEKVRVEMGFGMMATSPAAADVWNDAIGIMIAKQGGNF